MIKNANDLIAYLQSLPEDKRTLPLLAARNSERFNLGTACVRQKRESDDEDDCTLEDLDVGASYLVLTLDY